MSRNTAPTEPTREPAGARPQLTLYSRKWCHLCDDMQEAVAPLAARFDARIDVVDIDADPALVALYDELVPVLICAGVEVSRYRLDPARVLAALERYPVPLR